MGRTANKTTASKKRVPSPANSEVDDEQSCCQHLMQHMESMFEKLSDKIVELMSRNFDTKLAVAEKDSFECNQKIDNLQKQLAIEQSKNSKLTEKVTTLEKSLASILTRLDDMEQYTRKDNILIHGIEEQPDEKLSEKITHLFISKLNLSISSDDISIAHRLPQKNNNSTKPKPTIVRMVRRKEKDNIMRERRKLKGSGISLTEHLTSPRTKLLQAAQDYVTKGQLAAAWSSDCRIFASLREGHKTVVTCLEDLQSLTSR